MVSSYYIDADHVWNPPTQPHERMTQTVEDADQAWTELHKINRDLYQDQIGCGDAHTIGRCGCPDC